MEKQERYYDMYAGKSLEKTTREDIRRINGARTDLKISLRVKLLEILITSNRKVRMMVKGLTAVNMRIDPDVDLGYKIREL